MVYYSSPSPSISSSFLSLTSSSCSEDYEKEDEKTNPPLLLSTERVEEQLDIDGEGKVEAPTQYTVAVLLNLIIERGIELPDTDDEEGFEAGVGMGELGKEGVGMGGLEEEEVLREIGIWERERVRGDAEGGRKGEKDGVDDDFTTAVAAASEVHSPTSIYSFDEHATTAPVPHPHPTPNQPKNKHPSSHTDKALSTLSTHLAMGERVVDTQKVLREWDEAEARGEGYDMLARVKELQNGKAGDCGPLVDGLGGWLRG